MEEKGVKGKIREMAFLLLLIPIGKTLKIFLLLNLHQSKPDPEYY